MNYITTTELRTKASKLKDSLQKGESTYILHRSQVIGVIEPYKAEKEVPAEKKLVTFTLDKLKKLHKAFPPSKVQYTYAERAKIWGDHRREKYGKDIS